jgi:hypothetical protein
MVIVDKETHEALPTGSTTVFEEHLKIIQLQWA